MSIRVFYDGIKEKISDHAEVKRFLLKVIRNENKTPGDLNLILTTDEQLLKINREFLKHDYLTDVIAFDYSERSVVSGEIYISIDTVKRNSHKYKVSFSEEIIRVMIHGVLHLCGYDDRSEAGSEIMKKREDERVDEYFRRRWSSYSI